MSAISTFRSLFSHDLITGGDPYANDISIFIVKRTEAQTIIESINFWLINVRHRPTNMLRMARIISVT